ncbi:MAG: flagellar motor switch protein FliM [Sphingomonadales bacterium]
MADEIEGTEGDGAVDEEAMAAEWAAMAGDDDPDESDPDALPNGDDSLGADAGEDEDEPTGPARVLNQDEIDSLLGFDGDDDGDLNKSGIHAIINSALVSYERLPMLEIVFDRLVRLMSTSLRNFTSDNIEVSLDNITSIRFGDYLNSVPLPAMLTVFRAEEWDNYGLITVDSSLIYSIVDVLLGGRRGTAAMRIEGRPYTTIEQSLVERMIEVILADMCAAFEPLSKVTFAFDRLETNPRFASIVRHANAAILIKLRIDMEERGGRLEMLLPYATLEPVRELLLQRFMGEKFGRDSIWEVHLANELWHTYLPFEAILDEQTMMLTDVMKFEVGQTMLLNARPASHIEMRCGETTLMTGSMGRVGKNVAVKVDQRFNKGNVKS